MGQYTVVGKENSWFVGALSPVNHMGGRGGGYVTTQEETLKNSYYNNTIRGCRLLSILLNTVVQSALVSTVYRPTGTRGITPTAIAPKYLV